jgi:AcrR family transcriptional regulator
MLSAMAEAVAEKGYVRATVADVIARAGVSRETYYQHFADKEDCFLAAFDMAGEAVARHVGEALDRPAAPGRDRLDRADAALGAYLEALASEPVLARTFLVEVYGAGERALARRVEVMERFVELVAGLIRPRDPRERFACEAIVGAVSSMVTMRVAAGDHASLPALRKPLMALAGDLLGEPGSSARAA